MILHKITEFARATIIRKEPLTAAPATHDFRVHIWPTETWGVRTNYCADFTYAFYFVIDVTADGNSNILNQCEIGPNTGHADCRLTTTITIVLWPSEKNNPHVTGSWPRLINPRVALSIALY
jgi:hypothetical protein